MKTYRVTLTITPPRGFSGYPRDLYYSVEAWDAEDAEDRAIARAVRDYGIWREWAFVTVELQTRRAG